MMPGVLLTYTVAIFFESITDAFLFCPAVPFRNCLIANSTSTTHRVTASAPNAIHCPCVHIHRIALAKGARQ